MCKQKDYWTIKEGKEILISDMDTMHIYNTLNMIERKCAEGFTVTYRFGTYGSTYEDCYYDEDYKFYKGKRALDYFESTDNLVKELRKREKQDNKKYINENWKYVINKI